MPRTRADPGVVAEAALLANPFGVQDMINGAAKLNAPFASHGTRLKGEQKGSCLALTQALGLHCFVGQ
jgi:hypothetical protein